MSSDNASSVTGSVRDAAVQTREIHKNVLHVQLSRFHNPSFYQTKPRYPIVALRIRNPTLYLYIRIRIGDYHSNIHCYA